MIYESRKFTVKDGLEIELKTPEKGEAKALLDFVKEMVSQTEFMLSTPEDLTFEPEQEAEFIEDNRNGDGWFVAVYTGGRIIGDCNITFCKRKKDRHRATVGIGIDKDYWNMGIGSLLFDELIRLAYERPETEQIELEVASNNVRAKHLYEKKGFVRFATIPHALKLQNGTYINEDLMIKYL